MQYYIMPANIFFIATVDSSSSTWLAEVLSLHPNIHDFYSNESLPEPNLHEHPYFSQPSRQYPRSVYSFCWAVFMQLQ